MVGWWGAASGKARCLDRVAKNAKGHGVMTAPRWEDKGGLGSVSHEVPEMHLRG